MACGSVVDAAFQVQIDEWRGRRTVKCMLDVIEPACPCPALRACLPSEDVDFIRELCEATRETVRKPPIADANPNGAADASSGKRPHVGGLSF